MSSPRGEEEGHTEREKPVISETEFLEDFMSMKSMMEILLDERIERKKKEEGSSSKEAEVKKEEKGKGVGPVMVILLKLIKPSLLLILLIQIMQVLICLISNWM